MITFPSQYSMLYSDKSPCTMFAKRNIFRIAQTTSWYRCLSRVILSPETSLRRGAGQPKRPTNDMTRTGLRNKIGSGHATPTERSRAKFRNSFSAHTATILRALLLWYPFRKRKSPSTYLSRSLNTRMEVLKTLTATGRSAAAIPVYTFASLPVLTQPSTRSRIPRDSILKRIILVAGSKTCSTVARSARSLSRELDPPIPSSHARPPRRRSHSITSNSSPHSFSSSSIRSTRKNPTTRFTHYPLPP
mmetsp:Transcript_4474/g.8901  ORF Transcript_4474/g.8901 Transcript_4474/m.8901 type:complete len:247 (-) Transcript_4474:1352-2092(-)